jgi:hypothetical protein
MLHFFHNIFLKIACGEKACMPNYYLVPVLSPKLNSGGLANTFFSNIIIASFSARWTSKFKE